MAGSLAGLLTSAVVDIVKDKLAAAKAYLLWNFDDGLEDMSSKLETISALLQDAERRSAKDKHVQLWLKRLKHAALDIADMLEDNQDTSDRLTAKKPGVHVLSWMKSMREELIQINEDCQYFSFTRGCTSTSVEPDYVDRVTSSLLIENLIGRNGEKQDIIKLLSACANNDETVIVPIYGLGGMGKSSLAQLVYNDAQFKEYDHRIWVYVSPDFDLKEIGRCIISELLREQIQQNWDTLQINQCLDNLLRGKKVLIVLDDLWEEKDIELGNLRSMLQVGKKGTTIDVIVTTRKEDIARKVSTCTPYKLQPLNDYTCWEIIKRCSRWEDDQHYQERLEQIGLDIAKKCGGVALAAKAVGSMLRYKNHRWTEISNSDTWNESFDYGVVLSSLKLSYERMQPQLSKCFSYCAIFPKGHSISEDDLIHQWIALDFIEHPSQGKEYIRELLGMSFLELSKLPKTSGDHMERYTMHVLVHDLATLIVGDDLIVSYVASKNNKADSQQYCFYASVTKYNPTTRLSNILPSKLRALHFLDSGKLDLSREAFSFAKCLRILDFSGCSGILLPASIGQLKHLKSLTAPQMQNDVFPEFMTELSKLKYLNLDGSAHISGLSESIGKLGSLRYLGLSGCSGIRELPASLGNLTNLQHLTLSGCSGIRELPASLGNLTNLQHLTLSGCSGISKLPASIGNLTNLLHLDLSECSGVKAIPESLCGLMHLQYLNLSSCRYITRLPRGIGRLVHLRTLDIRVTKLRELPWEVENSISVLVGDLHSHKMVKLAEAVCPDLVISSSEANCRGPLSIVFVDPFNPRYEPLQVPLLRVDGRQMKVPQWVKQDLRNVCNLDIRLCKLVHEDLEFLKTQMPNLQALQLRFEVLPREQVTITGGGFLKLDTFCVDCRLPQVITFKREAMPKLKHLEFKFYTGTASRDYDMGIKHLDSLEKVVFRCSEYYTSDGPGIRETIDVLRKEAVDHPNKITLWVNDMKHEEHAVFGSDATWISLADKAIVEKRHKLLRAALDRV